MFKQFLRSLGRSPALKATSIVPLGTSIPVESIGGAIKFYHYPSSQASGQLLNKLKSLSKLPIRNATNDTATDKFGLNVVTNSRLSYEDYRYIFDECINVHPGNKLILAKILPHGPCSRSYDLEPALDRQFFDEQNVIRGPLVIDYHNSLIANDDESLDRIMQHYLSCGMQRLPTAQAAPASLGDHQWAAALQESLRDLKTSGSKPVHPHVAEYADLF
ncbi:uncharacterized protein KQ657_004074 [Scheffersomyces spartinae]|uniref:Uncharacterized protein n=1 Tax=Scheffersomyces spartinae TaxID=45513 RepID=A0A9P7VBG9_9ASCO|nr:uncharacterized protein KQ657_004074 [Scheffersomyces spartinae]KAG7194963.1 hypothetical protein KQ657_004074 [Scheffersomyces spartinae]